MVAHVNLRLDSLKFIKELNEIEKFLFFKSLAVGFNSIARTHTQPARSTAEPKIAEVGVVVFLFFPHLLSPLVSQRAHRQETAKKRDMLTDLYRKRLFSV
jgi:hypothetical protein